MLVGLEVSLDSNLLYLGCEPGTNLHRPIFTGDVFDAIENDSPRLLVAEHPCSMRAGIELAATVLVAPVLDRDPVPSRQWENGYYNSFPLPDLDGVGSFGVARLDRLNRCETAQLVPERRIACMLPLGVNLFQHRLVWYLTRCCVPSRTLDEAFSRYYEEADLIEIWMERAFGAAADPMEAAKAAEAALGQIEQGDQSLREMLADPQRRAFVRRRMDQLGEEHYPRRS